MPHPKFHPILVAAFAALTIAESSAQVPTTLLKPGDTLDWQGQSRTVNVVYEPKINQFGCRGMSIRLEPLGQPADSDSVYWGSCGGEAPRILRGPRTIGGVQQRSISADHWGFDEAGEIVYHARLASVGSSVWVGDTLIVQAGDPVPGMVDRFFTNPGAFGVLATTGGGPVFVSNIRTGAGNNAAVGLFQGAPPVPLLLSGDSIPGLSSPLASQPVSPVNIWRYIDISPNGDHWASLVELVGGESALVVDGQAATVNGLPVETGAPVPATIASQATWQSIDAVHVDDQGRWTALLTYRLATGQLIDVVFRDGVPIVSEGTTLGALGAIWALERIHTSRNGRLAFVALAGSSGDHHLIVDRRLAISEGNDIDYTGDGVVDPGYRLLSLGSFVTGTALDDDGTVWSTARIGLPAGGVDYVLLELPGSELGARFCSPAIANSTGTPARITARGHAVAGGLPLTLRASGLPVHRAGMLIASQATASVPMAGGSLGTLCLGGVVSRFVAQVADSGPGGVFEIDVDTTNIPGLPPVVVQPGETWSFQAWYRDSNPGGNTSNFTDAVSVTFH